MNPVIVAAVNLLTRRQCETSPWGIAPAVAYVHAAQKQPKREGRQIKRRTVSTSLFIDLPSDALAHAEDASREITRLDAELGGEIEAEAEVGP